MEKVVVTVGNKTYNCQSAKELLEKNGFNITNITDKIDNFKFNI